MTHIPVYTPYLGGNVKSYVLQCIETGWISSRGEFVDRFEAAFTDFLGAKQATSVSNGTVALHLALTALGIGPGDEVIVPTFTYIASVNAILQTGAAPVFADSLEDTLQVDPECVRNLITSRTKAVMAVHLYGHPCDMDLLCSLCDERSLLLIEDAAEAFGTRWKDKHAGTFGDIATFSFFGNKTITTGEGGMVVARDTRIMERCRHLKNQGVSKTREYWHDAVAFNYRMTNIQAAIGLAQLEDALTILQKKQNIFFGYREALTGLPLRMHDPVGPVEHSFWMSSIVVDDDRDRDRLRAHLAQAGIETRPFFSPAHTMPHCRFDASFPVAEAISARGINLPSSPLLTEAESSRICDSIRRYFISR